MPGPVTSIYELICGGTDEAINASYTMTARYWVLDTVAYIDLGVETIEYGLPVLDPTAVARMFLPFVTLVGGDKAGDWMQLKLADPACIRNSCTKSISGVRYSGEWGTQGSGFIYIDPA